MGPISHRLLKVASREMMEAKMEAQIAGGGGGGGDNKIKTQGCKVILSSLRSEKKTGREH